jgi:sterol desaturase/sphingolipid hydroxylase (fatty acid hydroxylase superfamily)
VSLELEYLIGLAFYAPIVATMVLETLAPRRRLVRSTGRRWLHTSGLWLVNSFLSRITLATSALAAAVLAADHAWGLIPMLALPATVAFVVGFVLLDFASYFKHRAFHMVPALWRFHVVHHSDAEMDVATCLRSHPGDVLIDGLMMVGVVILLGVPTDALLAQQLITTISNPLHHGNFVIAPWLEAVLRPALMTPDLHRVHHSAIERETNSNFGALFTCWDRLLGTYRAQPERGHETMEIGVEYFRDPAEDRLLSMLTQPLRQPRARNENRTTPRVA